MLETAIFDLDVAKLGIKLLILALEVLGFGTKLTILDLQLRDLRLEDGESVVLGRCL